MMQLCKTDAIIRSILLRDAYLRIGEAKNPGPCEASAGLTIGCFNPTGIMYKTDSIDLLPNRGSAIWGACESHLSKPGIHKFQQELMFKKSKYKFFPGAPAPMKSQSASSIGGKQLGVGFLTDLPTRALQHSWPKESWQEARFSMQAFFYQSHWVFGATFYGFAYKADTQEVKNRTDDLLSHLTQRLVVNMKGKRFIVGDFNQTNGQLQQTAIWQSYGWKEIQIMAHERFGKQIQNTCKGATVKDFVWISPELQPFFLDTETMDIFPDHLAVCAHFSPFGPPDPMFLWTKPKAIGWSEIEGPIADQGFNQSLSEFASADEFMKQISQQFENRVDDKLKEKNKTKLLKCQKGRSCTLEVKKTQQTIAPIKPSRHGEIEPDAMCTSLQYKQWFTQSRRLQSLIRLATKPPPLTITQEVHKHREWRAVLHASGFHGGFRQWWEKLDRKMDFAPATLPFSVPPLEDLIHIKLNLEQQIGALQKVLKQNLIGRAKLNRQQDPNKIFADVRKPAVSPIVMLSDTKTMQIVDVNHDTSEVTVDDISSLDLQKPLYHDQGVLTIIQVCNESQKIAVQNTEALAPGLTIKQAEFAADLQELFTRFSTEWKARWDRHAEIPTDFWDPIISFYKTAVPPVSEIPCEPITLAQWKHALKKKNRHAAVGPDGWSRMDLLQLPDDLTSGILHMLSCIENGCNWPKTIITGLVFSLEKVPNADRVGQYRPITVFSLIYRVWSSIRARACLRHLAKYAPSRCFGNLPNKAAMQVWLQIQSLIETTQADGTMASGTMVDVIKCFNHLPRIPIFEICAHLGIPSPIIRGWSNALCTMERRFSIRGSTSPAVRSSTGCAEGCALSVVGMLAINILVDTWLQYKAPLCKLWSYVDNLEITTKDADTTVAGLHELNRIMSALDLNLDPTKTFCWSTDAHERKILKDREQEVKMWARDLGGHVQYSRQATNSIITDRIKLFRDRWPAFARSHAPHRQKIKALKMVAWPNALHGATSIHLGNDHYEELRTGAMRGLTLQAWGASPLIQLSLVEHPSADPAFHVLWHTVADIRMHLPLETCERIFDEIALPTSRLRPKVGPCSVLLHRLHQVNWSWQANGYFLDGRGRMIHLWEAPIQDLYTRLCDDWQLHIMRQMSTRKTFGGLPECSPGLTNSNKPKDNSEKGLLQTILNGTFFTSEHQKYRAPGEHENCPFCGLPDNQKHRHWDCPELENVRDCPPNIKQRILEMQPATFNHGWIPRPDVLEPFRNAQDQIEDTTNEHNFPDCLPKILELFTDGSCLKPSDKTARLAAWGVTIACPQSNDEFQPVANGMVTGLVQTITRAELTAALAAIKFAVRCQQKFRLWIDNAFVVKIIQKCLSNKDFSFPNHKPNHDLLNQIRVLFDNHRNLCLGVVKVTSHADQIEADPAERWAIRGNQSADDCAAAAYSRNPTLLQMWFKLLEQLEELQTIRYWLHRTIIRVGFEAIRRTRQQKQEEKQLHTGEATMPQLEYQKWVLPLMPPDNRHFQIDQWGKLSRWTMSLHVEDCTTQWWSWPQLFIDFCLTARCAPPWYCRSSKNWKTSEHPPTNEFPKRCYWFSTFINKALKQLGMVNPGTFCRPDSHAISYWSTCMPIQVPEWRFDKVESWLFLQSSRFSASTDLKSIRRIPDTC